MRDNLTKKHCSFNQNEEFVFLLKDFFIRIINNYSIFPNHIK